LQVSSKTDWCLYVLRCADGTLYTGITNNLQKRLFSHNSGRGAKYTRSRTPCEVVATCPMPSKSDSLKAEHRFKKLSRQQKLQAIENGIDSLFPEHLHTNQDHGNANGNQGLGVQNGLVKEPPGEDGKSEI